MSIAGPGLRIVAGRFGGRSLAAPKDDVTRPTSGRVREALFSILDARGLVDGARVIDLYAGTGALGLEALSRGAEHATFVESRPKALECLSANVAALGVASASRVVPRAVAKAAAQLEEGPRARLVFADPPYADLDSSLTLALLSRIAVAVLDDEGLLIVESSTRTGLTLPGPIEVADARSWGHTEVTFFRRAAGA